MSFAARRGLLRALTRNDVDFVLIGGMAVIAHGHVRTTTDVDIVFDTAVENATRLAAALEELGAVVVSADTIPADDRITSDWLAKGGHLVFATDNGQLDTMSQTHGLSFRELAATAITSELADGSPVLVCSYDNLVKLKRAAGRSQDIADLEALRAVRGEGSPDDGAP